MLARWLILLGSTAQACQWHLAVARCHHQCTVLPCDFHSQIEIADENVERAEWNLEHKRQLWREARDKYYGNYNYAFDGVLWLCVLVLWKVTCGTKDWDAPNYNDDRPMRARGTLTDVLPAPDDVCSICWDKPGAWKRLPCHHVFHGPCIERWFEEHTICPNCTLDVLQ